jgi:hypothetical protein
MKKTTRLTGLITLALILSACNFPLLAENQNEVNDADQLATSVAGTIQAMTLPEQPTLTVPAATAAPAATQMPVNTVVSPPTATPQPCNRAEFISETIPDDTVFNLGESFTKTWTFKNTGTCTWNTNYKLVFVSGDSMSGEASINLTQSVAPDTQVTVSVPLKAPSTAGTYTGYWALKADDETVFFSTISVQIQASAGAFQVSSVTTNLVNRSPDECPYDYAYTLSVTSTSAGKVTYTITDSDNETSGTKSLTFTEAGTLKEDLNWSISQSGTYWVKVYIDKPNHQWFGPFEFEITCP